MQFQGGSSKFQCRFIIAQQCLLDRAVKSTLQRSVDGGTRTKKDLIDPTISLIAQLLSDNDHILLHLTVVS